MTTEEREQLILNYIPLANKLAWKKSKTTPKSVTIDELKSAAYFGLVDAASRYKDDFGTSFGPFARLRICGEISDYLRELSWGKKNSVGMVSIDDWSETLQCSDTFQNYFDLLIETLNALGKQIMKMYYVESRTLREIGEIVGLSESRISQLLSKYRNLIRREFSDEKIAA
jgi:RNA polymerase sigma factor (sigma-70 family)